MSAKPCSFSAVIHQGLGILQAPGEGEATCAALNASNLVDACVTNDSDALLFGAKKLYKTFNLSVSFDAQNIMRPPSLQC